MPSPALEQSDEDRSTLASWTRSRTLSAAHAERGRIVLVVAAGANRRGYRLEPGRGPRRHRPLHEAEVGRPEAADVPVAPRLLAKPVHRVGAVVRVAHHRRELAVRAVRAPAVLEHHRVPGLEQRLDVEGVAQQVRDVLAVGGPDQQRRARRRGSKGPWRGSARLASTPLRPSRPGSSS